MTQFEQHPNTVLPVPAPLAGKNSGSINVPTVWIMILVVPLFLGAIAIQGIELTKRVRHREVTVDNAASVREFQRAKSAYEEQTIEWQKLAESSKKQLNAAQSEVVQLQTNIKVYSEEANAKATMAAEAKQKLDSLNAEILAKRTELSATEADFQTARSRKHAIENVNIDLQKDYAAKKAEIEQLERKLSTLVAELATNSARIKVQMDELKANDLAKVELVREKAELAGIKQEKSTASDILSALKTEIDRLVEDRSKRKVELDDLNSQISSLQEQLKKLGKERASLAGEIEKLKSNFKSTDQNALSNSKPEGQ